MDWTFESGWSQRRASNGSPIRVDGGATLEFVWDGKKCNMRFLDADVKRPLASVSVI